jgi:hypothetical protein
MPERAEAQAREVSVDQNHGSSLMLYVLPMAEEGAFFVDCFSNFMISYTLSGLLQL